MWNPYPLGGGLLRPCEGAECAVGRMEDCVPGWWGGLGERLVIIKGHSLWLYEACFLFLRACASRFEVLRRKTRCTYTDTTILLWKLRFFFFLQKQRSVFWWANFFRSPCSTNVLASRFSTDLTQVCFSAPMEKITHGPQAQVRTHRDERGEQGLWEGHWCLKPVRCEEHVRLLKGHSPLLFVFIAYLCGPDYESYPLCSVWCP